MWTVGQLREATQGTLAVGDPQLPISGVSLDSRALKGGEAFVAIRGRRFDAHAFLPEAIHRGAGCLIVDQAPAPMPSVPTIRVPDTVKALGAIASFHRALFNIPVVAITGSCGKTTTKELIAGLLTCRSRVVKTYQTQNNHIGLPLTLLRLTPSDEVAVVELGSNHPGEIAYLAQIAQPTVAVITNVGPAHLEFFGSLLGVLREKLSLLESLGPQGIAVVPGDQLEVVLEARLRLGPGRRLLTFGTSDRCDVQAVQIRQRQTSWSMRVRDVEGEFVISLPGSHNVENALAALACMHALGVPLTSCQEPLTACRAVSMRTEVVRCGDVTVLNDCYNANPLSFSRALETLQDLDASRRVLIAGEMLELGDYAPSAHQAIGRLAAQCGIDVIVAVGRLTEDVVRGAAELAHRDVRTYPTVAELIEALPSLIRPGDTVLVKGSRGMKLEQVVARIVGDGRVKSPQADAASVG